MALEKKKKVNGAGQYLSWNTAAGKAKALKEYGEVVGIIQKSNAAYYNNFQDIDTHVSTKTGFGRDNYEYFRLGESIPKRPKDAIEMCISAYNKIGIVKNVIDLMSDFACQGIDVVHPIARTNKFLKKWFKKVDGVERSERFLTQFYRSGIVLCRRNTAKLKPKQAETLEYAEASADIEVVNPEKVQRNEIPIRYRFINPLKVDLVDETLAEFGVYIYGYEIPTTIRDAVKNPDTPIKQAIVSKLSPEVKAAVERNDNHVVINPEKLITAYYKKDDWQLWPLPMTYAILEDLIILEKMKLADLAALDGAISNIRLWRLGSLEYGILPSKQQITFLSNMLLNNPGGGSLDFVWGPELEMIESKTTVHQFLGSAKYEAILSFINAGLGIPPTLTGSSTESGFTNNYISIKTLLERLEYGREALVKFWEHELDLVLQAKGFKGNATIKFGHMSLSDESAEKALMIDLVDRDIISWETLVERFGEMPELEQYRLNREQKLREKHKMPNKITPYSNLENDLTKLFVGNGLMTPSEVGIELYDRKAGEETKVEVDNKLRQDEIKMKGIPGMGRPKNAMDKKKRKTKTVKPRSKGALSSATVDFLNCVGWANEVQKSVSAQLTPAYLEANNKQYVKELTQKQVDELENIKFGVLFNIEPFTDISKANLSNYMTDVKVPGRANHIFSSLLSNVVKKTGKPATIDQYRNIQSYVYSIMKGL